MEDSTRAHGEIEAIPSGPALPARHGRLGLARVDRGGRIDRIGDTRRRTTGTGTVPVGRMTPGDHFCFVYDTDAEADAVVTTFLLDGVRTGQKVLYLSDRREPADDPVAVGHEELVAAREEGQLDVLTGGDRPALDAGLRRAARDGDTAVRITSAPGTEAARTWSEEYERTIRTAFDPQRVLALCAYDRRRVDQDELTSIDGSHGGAVRPNDHYDDGLLRIGPLFTRPGAALIGDLDLTVADRVLSILRRICAGLPGRVHLDLSGLGFCDAGSARALVRLAADLTASRQELILLGPPRHLRDLLAPAVTHLPRRTANDHEFMIIRAGWSGAVSAGRWPRRRGTRRRPWRD